MSNAAKVAIPGGSDGGKAWVYNSGTDAFDLTDIVTAAEATAGYQPLDSDLTAIAALTTTAFGRALLALADAAALRTAAGLGTIATQASSNVTITGGSVTGITDLAVADGGTGASDAATALTNLGAQPLDSDLTAIAALSTTAFGRAFLTLADAAAARTLIGVVIGTDVQAQDAELSAIAGLVSAADRLPYFTGSGTASLATFTAAGRALVDDANAAAQLTTLGVSAFAQTILDDADAATVRATIGAVIGTNVQAFDQDLADIAGVTRNKGDLLVGSSTAWSDLAVGTDGQVLTADAAQTLGVKWATPSGGGGGSFDPLANDAWFAAQFWI